jgi:hypothetical protein
MENILWIIIVLGFIVGCDCRHNNSSEPNEPKKPKKTDLEIQAPLMINNKRFSFYFQDPDTLVVFLICKVSPEGNINYEVIPTDQIDAIKNKIDGYKEPPFLTEYKKRINRVPVSQKHTKTDKPDSPSEENLYNYFED